MRPRKKRLTHVLNILKVIADRDSKSRVVLGHTEIDGDCGAHRCVLGWYNHIFQQDNPLQFDEFEGPADFGISERDYLKIFGWGSDATSTPLDPDFDEEQTRKEMRKRIRVVEKILGL